MARSGIQLHPQPWRRRRFLIGAAIAIIGALVAFISSSADMKTAGAIGGLIGLAWTAVSSFWKETGTKSLDDEAQGARAKSKLERAVSPYTASVDGKGVCTVSEYTGKWPGTRESLFPLEYRTRDAEKELTELLSQPNPPPILVLGNSMAGKTTLVEHVIRKLFPDHCLYLATSDGLPKLISDAAFTPKSVVVLDELDRHLNNPALQDHWLASITKGGGIVVATMRSHALSQFTTTPEGLSHPHRSSIDMMERVVVKHDDPKENERLAATVDDPQAQEIIRRDGIGAYAGGGYAAVSKYESEKNTHKLGAAMVQAAVYWRILGLTWIGRQDIEDLALSTYLPERYRNATEENADDALAWATAWIDNVAQLLENGPEETFRSSDYIQDHLTHPLDTVSDETWRAATKTAQEAPEQAFSLAVNALKTNKAAFAQELFTYSTETQNISIRAASFFNLGNLERDAGNIDKARNLYQQAIKAGDTQALNMLGLLEAEVGNIDKARNLYDRAIKAGNLKALLYLGYLGDLTGITNTTRDLHKQATDIEHLNALLNLGKLENEAGNTEEAHRLWTMASRSDNSDVREEALKLLKELDETENE